MERDLSVGDAKPDRQLGHSRSQDLADEKHDVAPHPSPQRSLARSIAIVATCTGALIVNVRLRTFSCSCAR